MSHPWSQTHKGFRCTKKVPCTHGCYHLYTCKKGILTKSCCPLKPSNRLPNVWGWRTRPSLGPLLSYSDGGTPLGRPSPVTLVRGDVSSRWTRRSWWGETKSVEGRSETHPPLQVRTWGVSPLLDFIGVCVLPPSEISLLFLLSVRNRRRY